MQAYDTETLRHLVQNDRVHRDFYTSPEVFEIEMERIFGRAWLLVAMQARSRRPAITSRRPLPASR